MKFLVIPNDLSSVPQWEQTDFSDWAILHYVKSWMAYPLARRVELGGKLYVWISYTHAMKAIPLLKISRKESFSRRIHKLVDLGLLEVLRDRDGRLFATLTEAAIKAWGEMPPFQDDAGQTHDDEHSTNANQGDDTTDEANGTTPDQDIDPGGGVDANVNGPLTHESTELILKIKNKISVPNGTEATHVASEDEQSTTKRKRKDGEDPDPRVKPTLDHFYAKFKEKFGTPPTSQHLNFGRDGKRIRELPKDITTEVLTSAISRFFSSRDSYITRSYTFTDFIFSFPKLALQDATGNQSKPSPPPKASTFTNPTSDSTGLRSCPECGKPTRLTLCPQCQERFYGYIEINED